MVWSSSVPEFFLLISVYNCDGLSLSVLKRREKKSESESCQLVTIEELSSGNHPFNPPFNCTVLYKNVLNVLVLGTFL